MDSAAKSSMVKKSNDIHVTKSGKVLHEQVRNDRLSRREEMYET